MSRADLLVVPIMVLPHGLGLGLPSYQSAGAAGMDLIAAVDLAAEPILDPGDRRLIPCGFKISVPVGYEAQVRSRSGLALKAGLCLANGVGTIDSDYTGEVGVPIWNAGPKAVKITRGLRLAQLILGPVARVVWDEVGELVATARGDSGFGSTGVK